MGFWGAARPSFPNHTPRPSPLRNTDRLPSNIAPRGEGEQGGRDKPQIFPVSFATAFFPSSSSSFFPWRYCHILLLDPVLSFSLVSPLGFALAQNPSWLCVESWRRRALPNLPKLSVRTWGAFGAFQVGFVLCFLFPHVDVFAFTMFCFGCRIILFVLVQALAPATRWSG